MLLARVATLPKWPVNRPAPTPQTPARPTPADPYPAAPVAQPSQPTAQPPRYPDSPAIRLIVVANTNDPNRNDSSACPRAVARMSLRPMFVSDTW